MLVVQIVCFNDKHFALVIPDPFFVSLIEIAEVFYADTLFLVASSFLDLCYESRDRSLEIDEKIRLMYH